MEPYIEEEQRRGQIMNKSWESLTISRQTTIWIRRGSMNVVCDIDHTRTVRFNNVLRAVREDMFCPTAAHRLLSFMECAVRLQGVFHQEGAVVPEAVQPICRDLLKLVCSMILSEGSGVAGRSQLKGDRRDETRSETRTRPMCRVRDNDHRIRTT
ncbi:hypothetical protein ARMGADRAFT_1090871 [Armillaria gallica]|uniref:Uncharacterized protein n=1 Tax=Armillaria gallica TaxID=47427 RepID=A0A2H3CFH8_ARMGA|nr:hypothetical protein ARMGADRAFT_1090871 [Armillaria gallica]